MWRRHWWRHLRRQIPEEVLFALNRLQEQGYEAYLVGGAPRDLLLSRSPEDWDLATDARPEEVKKIFANSLPLGEKFGTVRVLFDRLEVDITTYRQEGAYTDGRRPAWVSFTPSLQADLARRDFTINAIALDPLREKLVDPFGGVKALKQRLVKTVGDPEVRFGEDALRMLRFFRFQATLGFRGDRRTEKGIKPGNIVKISGERIGDELTKLLVSASPKTGLEGMARSGLLTALFPELSAVREEPALFRHTVETVQAIKPETELRWAAFLHDIGKPQTRVDKGNRLHFYGHEKVGTELAAAILERLRFSRKVADKILTLVRWHMFPADPWMTDAALRRLVVRVGKENIYALLELRRADLVGTPGVSYRAFAGLSHFAARLEALLAGETVLSLRDLAVNGHELMEFLGIPPGPRVGAVLQEIFHWVTDDPARNRKELILEYLEKRYK
ncbi:MAG: CCA tRNA nucleotidyltransferase [Firmicutes bacterium]|nr:CCA tRNA nucleotidyltransferase [Bacillota bacterium]